MDEKMKEVEQHIWKSHPAWNLAYTGWYQCEVCKKEYHSKVIPPIFPRGICEIRILRFHISALESQLKEAKHQIDFQIKNYLADHELMSEYRIKWEQSEAKIKEKEKRIEELEKIISDGVLKDHNGCQIYRDEEYTKLELKFYMTEARIEELEEIIGYVKNNEIYEVKRLFDDPEKEIERLISHLDLAISAGREGWKRVEELGEGIKDVLGESTISYVVEKRLKKLIKKGKSDET